MGRATRWLKGIFGIKPSNSSDRRRSPAGDLCGSHETVPPHISEREAAWLRSFYAAGEAEKERRTHAIAVAAAAADAAVAAAKAAAAAVHITVGQGKASHFGDKNWAALKIQCAFKGYLARKALRALRGVVKIQALVRGYLVRRQAAATLRSMEALVRAQATVKFHMALLRSSNGGPARKSTERLSGSLENRSNGEETAKIVEVDTGTRPGSPRSRKNHSPGLDLFDDPFRRTFSSPLSGRVPPHLSTRKPHWDECSSKFLTAQSTPRFAYGGSPSRSACYCSGGDGDVHRRCFFSGDFHSNYMTGTTSFRAKLRSRSAPRQRPETAAVVARGGWRSGGVRVRMPSYSGDREAVCFRDAVVGKIDRVKDQW